MNNYLTLISVVAPVFGLMALGFAARRVRWLNAEADASLLRLSVNLLYPCLILDNVLGNPLLAKPGVVLLAPVVGFGTVLLGYLVSYFAAKILRLGTPQQQRTFGFATGIYNYGYIPVPLIQSIFATSSATLGVLFIHNVGAEICLWTAGVMVVTGTSLRDGWRKILNPPVVAILSALLLNFAGGKNWLPTFVLTTAHLAGAAAIPLGLILTGASFADLMRGARLGDGWKFVVASCALRLLVLPACFLLLARWLPCSIELKHVIVVEAAMPAAVFPIILTKHYGGDPSVALQVVLGTTMVSLLTIPVWIHFGMAFVGLETSGL